MTDRSELTAAEYDDIADHPGLHPELCPGGAVGLAEWLGIDYRRGTGRGYDLAGPEIDQPRRTPQRSLIVAATYRSGSTLIAEELIRAGGHGWPLEYLQRGADTSRFRRFAGGGDYLANVMSHRTDAAGTFGIKLFPTDVREWAIDRLPAVFPDPVVVWVRRQDRVAQAVSALRALRGGPWRSIDAPAGAPPAFDFDALFRLTGLFHSQDRWWAARWGRESPPAPQPITVWFEDVQRDERTCVQQMVAELSQRGRPSTQDPGPARLRPQADSWSGQMIRTFVDQYRSGRRPPASSPAES